jgi:PD-(D/E)XK nuclease superfamily
MIAIMQCMENELSHKIIGAAIEVLRNLGGPGLFQSIYEEALGYERVCQFFCVNRFSHLLNLVCLHKPLLDGK